MAKKLSKKDGAEKFTAATPIGRFMYPSVCKVNQFGAYSCEILIDKKDMASDSGKLFLKTIKASLEAKYGKGTTLDDLKYPPVTKLESAPGFPDGCYKVKAKNSGDIQPYICDASGKTLDPESRAAQAIKSGDYGRMFVSNYFYDNQFGEGMSLNVDAIQFQKAGDPLSGGASKALKLIDSIEVTEEDMEEPEDISSDQEDDDDDLDNF